MLLVIYSAFWLRNLNSVTVLVVSHHLAEDRIIGKKFWKMRREKIEELQKGSLDDEVPQGIIVCMCSIVFGVLHMSVLAVARRTVNAVAQICKMLSHPGKCILI